MKKYDPEEIRCFVTTPLFDEKVTLDKDPSWPKISIITPSYNQAEFLEKTILSILNQNYPNLEYIIIDGQSDDSSLQIIRKYEKYLAYWVSEKDRGQVYALNKGFSKATGQIIGWQNSDDIYMPFAFTQIAELFLKHPHVDVVFGNTICIDENEGAIGEIRFTPFSALAHLYEGMSINNQSSFWRKDLFSRIGMLDTRLQFSMDYEFFLRAARKNAKFRLLRSYLGAFRTHPTSKSSTIAHVSQIDHAHISCMYKHSLVFSHLLKIISLLRRSVYYIVQGDIDYVLAGLVRRLKKIGYGKKYSKQSDPGN